MSEIKTEIKQLLEVEETIRILRQEKEGELRKQFLENEFRTNHYEINKNL
jgi:hypothetical protein